MKNGAFKVERWSRRKSGWASLETGTQRFQFIVKFTSCSTNHTENQILYQQQKALLLDENIIMVIQAKRMITSNGQVEKKIDE